MLYGLGAALAGSALVGTVGGTAARGRNPFDTPNSNYERGEAASIAGDDDVWTFATTNRADEPTHLGIWMSSDAFERLTSQSEGRHLKLDFPDVDGLAYTFAGIDWNPAGHPPADVWTTPHFDFHYYFVDEAAVDAIVTPGPLPFMGVATYDLPEAFWPENYVYEEPRFIVKAMGEHLYDETSPEWDPTVPFTHTYIYGAYDFAIDPTEPDGTLQLPLGPGGSLLDLPTYLGGGTGQLTFTEPMITEAFMRDVAASAAGEVTTAVPLPSAFPEAGYYPTSYTTRYVGSADAYAITLEEFVWVDAYTA
ncbi:hypothetical protein HUG10_15650 [Halorarum halophilum]|uniref:DUF5602 domain-containing protein n=1 Tax=Halorarum halophilum TaxID=2743090 RepID=A0A7D5GMN7_9EURY|nr:hypothetical protein [Halobaculum halophilum]QLG28887.1 hypothetical protein HUG10_15650 [Halobaculum halophilum]